MIDFDQAVKIAEDNISKLVKSAKDLVLEGVLISADDTLYEVTFSYDLERPEPLPASNVTAGANLLALANLIGKRREHKVFLVDSHTGQFRGFKNQKEQ